MYSLADLAKLSTICDDSKQQESAIFSGDKQEVQDGDSDHNITFADLLIFKNRCRLMILKFNIIICYLKLIYSCMITYKTYHL